MDIKKLIRFRPQLRNQPPTSCEAKAKGEAQREGQYLSGCLPHFNQARSGPLGSISD